MDVTKSPLISSGFNQKSLILSDITQTPQILMSTVWIFSSLSFFVSMCGTWKKKKIQIFQKFVQNSCVQNPFLDILSRLAWSNFDRFFLFFERDLENIRRKHCFQEYTA